MKILAIETSTSACSVALNIDGKIVEIYKLAPREHNQILLPMLHSLLATAELSLSQVDAIAFGCGPGSFTGIRIAAATTQGLACSYDIPIISISSLLILAQSAYAEFNIPNVIPCVDARMNEIYWAHCQLDQNNELMQFSHQELCTSYEKLLIPTETATQWMGVGDAWASYPLLTDKNQSILKGIAECYPHAKDCAKLAVSHKQQAPERALPRYLREI